MYRMSSRLELREVVSNATRRSSISIEVGAGVRMSGTVACRAQTAKGLILRAKLAAGLTLPTPAARTAAHPSWISIAGVLTGCGEVAERSKAAVC